MLKDNQGDGLYEEVIKKILFFGCILVAFFLLFLTFTAMWLGGFSYVFLGIGAITATISLSLIIWTPYKAKIYCIPLIVGLIPFYMLLPGKGSFNPNGILEYRSIADSGSPWFSGLSEQELVSMGEKWGYSELEKKSIINSGGLAKDYSEIKDENLYKQNASVVLDSWFFDRGHYWFYRPKHENRPLLIFLHGSGGNFKAYQKWFTPYAIKNDIALAFPTWGFGLWNEHQLNSRIQQVINNILIDCKIDESQIYICGLSQGSLTGIKTLCSGNLNVAGFISISGVPSLTEWEVGNIKDTPMLIFHGAKDERVSTNNTRKVVNTFKHMKSNIAYTEYPNEDHTLIKTKSDEILTKIFEWISIKN